MKILAFGAHPDDVETGMGGTIAKYARKGYEVLMIVVTIPSLPEVRRLEAEEAARRLASKVLVLDIEPKELLFGRTLVSRFDGLIKDFSPAIVFTHWNHDSHQDHSAVTNAVIASTRKTSCSLYMYEQAVPGQITPDTFRGQTFVDISDTIDAKLDSIRSHSSQFEKYGEDWLSGIRGRAQYRGYQMGVYFAEAFEVVKETLG